MDRKRDGGREESVKLPVGVKFKKETIFRLGRQGDNWCLTWAADDSQLVAMDDGDWMLEENRHHHLFRLNGNSRDFEREELSGYPRFKVGAGGWFGYGLISVDGIIYSAVSKTPDLLWSGPFIGVKLLRSEDNGQSWQRVDREGRRRDYPPDAPVVTRAAVEEMFFLMESGRPHQRHEAYPFSFFDFVQCGRDNSAAQDDFIYIYSPEGAQSNQLLLARVPKDQLEIRDAWQYCSGYDAAGLPRWSNDLERRRPVHTFPEKSKDGNYFGWYSWLPSVVWNAGLGLYIMVNGGTYAGYGMSDSDKDYYDRWMHTRSGSLGFWYAEKPYGPWKQFFYTDCWTADSDANLTYQPKLSPKWISADGRRMVLIWSDAMKNSAGVSHTINYRWNQMEIEIDLG